MQALRRRSAATRGFGAAVILVGAITASACSEPIPASVRTTTTVAGPVQCTPGPQDTVVGCRIDGTMVDDWMPAQPVRATKSPILVGTINQDTGATGAFPELTVADHVAFDFINTELGGVDGHPLELVACDTQFNPDRSQSCAQEMVTRKVVAVVGGIDIWGTGIATLDGNGIPLVGGIPVSFESMRTPTSFQFSGGIWGAAIGMGQYAVDQLHARRLAIIHTEFPPITDAATVAKQAIERHGGTAALVSVPPIGGDMVAAMNEAAATHPDAVVALTADTGCVPAIRTAEQIGLKVPIMLTGACAATKIVDELGPSINGKIFNLEAELDPANADNRLYRAIAAKYGPARKYEWQGAGTVSFRAVLNLYVQLRRIGADKITPAAIIAAFRAARDEPSFFGHPYTCDGKQMPGYPSMCSPQQTLGRIQNGAVTAVTGWLDVAAWAK